jgi:DNA (cytosine-5)-methyltransferase 1
MGADDFKITVPLNQALFGFGDAVCVPAVQWIARNYLNPVIEEFGPPVLPRASYTSVPVKYSR